jgi:hypothetical protein
MIYFFSLGVKIAFGSDVGPFPHGQQAIEFEYLVRFGMKPAVAIRSATILAADLMGWQNQGSFDREGEVRRYHRDDERSAAGDYLIRASEIRDEGWRSCSR